MRRADILRTSLVVLAMLAATACGDNAFGLDEWRELGKAEARWQANRPANYSYELNIGCFCANAGFWARIDVRGDSIVAVTAVDPQPGAPPIPLNYWPTVDGLFARLRDASNSNSDYITDVNASYDATYGYPILIEVSCDNSVTDCGESTAARNLQPLP